MLRNTDQVSEVRQVIYITILPWVTTICAAVLTLWWGASMMLEEPDAAALVGAIFLLPVAVLAWDVSRMLRRVLAVGG